MCPSVGWARRYPGPSGGKWFSKPVKKRHDCRVYLGIGVGDTRLLWFDPAASVRPLSRAGLRRRTQTYGKIKSRRSTGPRYLPVYVGLSRRRIVATRGMAVCRVYGARGPLRASTRRSEGGRLVCDRGRAQGSSAFVDEGGSDFRRGARREPRGLGGRRRDVKRFPRWEGYIFKVEVKEHLFFVKTVVPSKIKLFVH